MIDTIMIFAAGKGTRMRHLTKTTPKTLIKINNKPILFWILDFVIKCNIFKNIIINISYMGNQIENYIDEFNKNILQKNKYQSVPNIILIKEDAPLETGGAIKNMVITRSDILNNINDPNKAIVTMNSDMIFQTKKHDFNIFDWLIKKWDPIKMDFLLLLKRYKDIDDQEAPIKIDFFAKGNRNDNLKSFPNKIFLNKQLDEQINRQADECSIDNAFIYTGIQILKPLLISKYHKDIFSLREIYKINNNIYGDYIDNELISYYHASTDKDVNFLNKILN